MADTTDCRNVTILIVIAVIVMVCVMVYHRDSPLWQSNSDIYNQLAQAELRGALRISDNLNEILYYEKLANLGDRWSMHMVERAKNELCRYIDSLYDAAGEQMPEIDTTIIRAGGSI